MLSSVILLGRRGEEGKAGCSGPGPLGRRGRSPQDLSPLSPHSHPPAPHLWGWGGFSGGAIVGAPNSDCERGKETGCMAVTGFSCRQDSPGDPQDQVIPGFAHLCPALGTGTGVSCGPRLLWRSSQPGMGEMYAALLRPCLAGVCHLAASSGPRWGSRASTWRVAPKGLLGAGG